MRDNDLRANLAAVGQLTPGLEYDGALLDGKRRQAFCVELGFRFAVDVCTSLNEACSKLWVAHPARALELAKSQGTQRVLELAELCGTTPGAIALVQQATRPKRSQRQQIRDAVNDHARVRSMIRREVTFEPELWELVQQAAKLRKTNLGVIVREGVWKVVRDLPGAPRHQPRRVQPQNGARRRVG